MFLFGVKILSLTFSCFFETMKRMKRRENLKIEYISIEKLNTYGGNAKIHPAEQIEQIKQSIRDFGFNDPIAVWKDNEIIEGHGRYIACQELGMTEVPIIRLDRLSDEERRAYTLVHNKLTMNSGFDVDVLNRELEMIEGVDMTIYGISVSAEDAVRESDSDVGHICKNVYCPRCGKRVK